MQMVKRTFIILLIVWLSLVIFMPQRHFYYQLEHELAKQNVEINENKIKEGFFSLSIEGMKVYIKGIDLVHIKEVSFSTLLFSSNIKMKKIELDNSLADMIPTKLDAVSFSHFIWKPYEVKVLGEGDFGTFRGVINMNERKIHLDITEIIDLGVLKSQLKEGEEGLYYERSF